MSAVAIIPAAGFGRRFGGTLPKQFLPLDGIPLLARTMLAFQQADCVQAVVVAAHPDYSGEVRALAGEYGIAKLRACVPGGEERQHSIRNALAAAESTGAAIVLVHDAVRPFIDEVFLDSLVVAAERFGAVVPGLVPKETVKQVDSSNNVVHTPERALLRAVQTPQAFRREVLQNAYARAAAEGFVGTDDASVAEYAGYTVHVVDGREENIKITTPQDMALAALLLRGRTWPSDRRE